MSASIDSALPLPSGPSDTPPPSPLTGVDFSATLRVYTDEKVMKRFAHLNALLRVDRAAYPDPVGCRSWLVW